MKLPFAGRRARRAEKKAAALAAGTVAPEDVFVAHPDPSAIPDGGTSGSEDHDGARDLGGVRVGTDVTAATPDERAVAPAAAGGATGDARVTPITAPVPVVGSSAGGGPSPPPTLRFGFGDETGGGLPPPTLSSAAPAPAPTITAEVGSTGEGAVTAAPRKVVTIGFDGDLEEIETTTFDPSPVELPRPGVDPRLRARRIQVLRTEGRKRLRWVVLGGAALAVVIAGGLVLESPLFAINDVEVTGAVYTDPARVAEVVDDLDGATLLGADLGRAEATLAADPWVKRVRVERRLLRGVRIEIVERVPVSTYMGEDQRWRVLDGDGTVMAVLDPPGSKPVDPLELTLATPGPDLEPGATVPASLAGATGVVPRLPSDLRGRTCSLAVSEQGRIQLNLCDGFVVDLGSPDRVRDKLVSTVFVLNTMTDEVAASSGLDVGDPERPVLIEK